MERESYINLNGAWQYAITGGEEPSEYEGEILVPFSPESELSGVSRILMPNETLWYKREATLKKGFNIGRVLLNFGAVDERCEVFVNGRKVGGHIGGYTAFSLDITDFLNEKDNLFVVKVTDESDRSYNSRGKQRLNRGGIWYTPQSGIWQTVWLESVPKEYVKALVIKPLFDEAAVEVTAKSVADIDVEISACGKTAKGKTNRPIVLKIGDFEGWSPENPRLYDLFVSAGKDRIKSYFAMRKFSLEEDEKGIKRMFLNGRPYFQNGLLDQGYWSDGLYTAPSDEALVYDITAMKSLGFNMLRKHIKIEPMRWYYHCDRLGMLVWQDMINGGGKYKTAVISLPCFFNISINDHNYKAFGRESGKGRERYKIELCEMINQLISVPSLCLWTPFNEGWGQFDSKEITEMIKQLDKSRFIDPASGWHDQHIGELRTKHVYFKPYVFKPDKYGRATGLSEFGGYNLRIDGHCFNKKDFGYKRFASAEEFKKAFVALYENELIPAKKKGLCASVYTQVSDVEDELNGILTYDRRVEKLSAADIRETVIKLND